MSTTVPNRSGTRPKRSYGLFALATAIYVLGVCAFSAWSYFQHKTALLTHVDQSLVHALYSTELILDTSMLQRAAETGGLAEEEYSAYRQTLDRFAHDCGFDALGAVVRQTNTVCALVTGTSGSGILPGHSIGYRVPLSPPLAALVRAQIRSPATTIRFIDLALYGRLRVAVLYRPVSDESGYALIVVRDARQIHALLRRVVLQSLSQGFFLLAMAVPMIQLYNLAQRRNSRKLAELNDRLREEIAQQKARAAELKDAMHDLERFNAVTVGREQRIIELKAEVNTLLEQLERKKRYNVDHID